MRKCWWWVGTGDPRNPLETDGLDRVPFWATPLSGLLIGLATVALIIWA